jgi:hypothetical protein
MGMMIIQRLVGRGAQLFRRLAQGARGRELAVNGLFSLPGPLKAYKDCLISGPGGYVCFCGAKRDQQAPGGYRSLLGGGFT